MNWNLEVTERPSCMGMVGGTEPGPGTGCGWYMHGTELGVAGGIELDVAAWWLGAWWNRASWAWLHGYGGMELG